MILYRRLSRVLFFCVVLTWASGARADTVYLKSGKVIHGQIISQNKNGDVKLDLGGYPVEYFYDEIRGVKKDAALIEPGSEILSSPETIVREFNAALKKKDFSACLNYISPDHRTKFEQALEEIRGAGSGQTSFLETYIILEPKNEGVTCVIPVIQRFSDKTFRAVFQLSEHDSSWLIDDIHYEMKTFSRGQSVDLFKANSQISGNVILPEFYRPGDLTVSFRPVRGPAQYLGRENYSMTFSSDSLRGKTEVPYQISGLLPGKYKGFAVWDIQQPYWIPGLQKNNHPPSDGDFYSESDIVDISHPASTENINFLLKKYSL